ncbi:MAG: O-antigen ligase family protein [Clostridia bacterium]|nr:O-antigen ligase family protein [Clostridia bacterium]
MESVIVSAFSKLWNGILNVIRVSFSYRIFSVFSGFLKRVVRNSLFFGYFMRQESDGDSPKSRFSEVFSKWGVGITKGFSATGRLIGKIVRSSRILGIVYDFFANILFQSLRTYGIMLCVSAVSYITLTGIFNIIGPRSIIAAAVLFTAGGILLLSDVSIYSVLENSGLVKLICGKNGGVHRLSVVDRRQKSNHYAVAVIIGLVISVLPVFLPTIYAVAGVAAVFAIPVVIIWPVVGLAGLALTIAFIPTLAAAGLIVLIWIGVILNASLGKIQINKAFYKGKAALIYVIITLSGGILSFAVADSIPIALIYTAFISVVFLFIILVKNSLALKTILLASALAAFLTALIGIYQYLTGNIEIGWIDSEMFAGMVRIYSTFENPNVYGEYLLFMIPLGLVLFFSTRRWLYKLFWVGAGLALVAAMLLTMSRGCWIGLAAGIFVYFLIADRRFLWLFFAAVIVMPFVLPESIMVRLLSIGNLEDSSSLYRLYIWLGTFSMLKDYWLTGVGLGTKAFSGVYSAYAYNGILAPHPHNLYLNIMSETGIAGLLAFMWSAVTGLKNSISTAFSGAGFKRHMGAGLTAAFTGFFVQGIFDNVFYNYRMVLIFWMFIAMSFAFMLISKKADENG